MSEEVESRIAGQPISLVRSLLMQGIDEVWDEWLVQYVLGIDQSEASLILEELSKKGLIEPVPSRTGSRLWETSVAGQALTGLIKVKPMAREAVDRKLEELLAKIKTVRENPYYLYQVRRADVYGSYLGSDELLNSLDLAVALEPKAHDSQRQAALESVRVRAARDEGVIFSSMAQQFNWPQQEVLDFLNSRSRIIKVVMMEKADLRGPRRTIFEVKRATREKGRREDINQ